jgi:DNA (cytosine-5)-methyltransferase 1
LTGVAPAAWRQHRIRSGLMTFADQVSLFEQVQMVDLFAGPGGLDVAAHWLGLTVTGIEWDGNAQATRKAAGLDTFEHFKSDVTECSPAAFPHARILAGGPPCQTFTVAGSGAGRRALDQVLEFVKLMASTENEAELKALKGRLKKLVTDKTIDERTLLVLQPLRWVMEARNAGHPYETIVLEQVPAVLPVWKAMQEALEGMGYKADCDVLHTEEFGVPQTRRRAILIARLGDTRPLLPKPTHQRYRKGTPRAGVKAKPRGWKSMGEALPHRGEFEVISNYGTGGDPKARGRRFSHQPSATVTGKVSRNRLVSGEGKDLGRFRESEAGILQTFPADYPWSGGDRAQQIGNAIPPRLAAHVLAAALGWDLDVDAVDRAVAALWKTTRTSKPLQPKSK